MTESQSVAVARNMLGHVVALMRGGFSRHDLVEIDQRCTLAYAELQGISALDVPLAPAKPDPDEPIDAAYRNYCQGMLSKARPILVVPATAVSGLCGFTEGDEATDSSLNPRAFYNPQVDPRTLRDPLLNYVLHDDGWPPALYLDRAAMENDPRYKQLIGYVFVQDIETGKVLTYRRPAKNEEQRLKGLMSIGFGGHTEPRDFYAACGVDNDVTPADVMALDVLDAAVGRELHEELGLLPGSDQVELAHVGFVNHDDNPVGQVHYGLVYRALVRGIGDVTVNSEISEPVWLDIPTIYSQHLAELEVWSQMLVRYIFGRQQVTKELIVPMLPSTQEE